MLAGVGLLAAEDWPPLGDDDESRLAWPVTFAADCEDEFESLLISGEPDEAVEMADGEGERGPSSLLAAGSSSTFCGWSWLLSDFIVACVQWPFI